MVTADHRCFQFTAAVRGRTEQVLREGDGVVKLALLASVDIGERQWLRGSEATLGVDIEADPVPARSHLQVLWAVGC